MSLNNKCNLKGDNTKSFFTYFIQSLRRQKATIICEKEKENVQKKT